MSNAHNEDDLVEELYWWLDDPETTTISLTVEQVTTLVYYIDQLKMSIEDLGNETLAQTMEIVELRRKINELEDRK